MTLWHYTSQPGYRHPVGYELPVWADVMDPRSFSCQEILDVLGEYGLHPAPLGGDATELYVGIYRAACILIPLLACGGPHERLFHRVKSFWVVFGASA